MVTEQPTQAVVDAATRIINAAVNYHAFITAEVARQVADELAAAGLLSVDRDTQPTGDQQASDTVDTAELARHVRTVLPALRLANYVERWDESSPAVTALNGLLQFAGEDQVVAGELVDPDVASDAEDHKPLAARSIDATHVTLGWGVGIPISLHSQERRVRLCVTEGQARELAAVVPGRTLLVRETLPAQHGPWREVTR